MRFVGRACGPPGRSLLDVASACVASPAAPDWPQFPAGRTLHTYRGRNAVARACTTLGLGPGDEVLMPAWNCGAEVDAVLAAGAAVALCRVDLRGRLDLDDVRNRISPRTRAVYVIHYFGWPQDVAALREVCDDRGVLLLEDCALALFSAAQGRWLGSLGDASIFSFPKSLPVPDGGALVLRTTLPDAAPPMVRPARSRVLRRTLGLVRRRFARADLRWNPLAEADDRETAQEPAVRGGGRPGMVPGHRWDERTRDWSISEMTMRLLSQVEPEAVVARRRANFDRLDASVRHLRDVRPLFEDLPPGVCPLEYPVLVERRDAWAALLRARGVEALEWWSGYHPRLPWDEFPEACRLKDRVLALPVNQDLDDDLVGHVAARLTEASCALRGARSQAASAVS